MPSPVSIHRLRTTSASVGAAEELNAPVIIDHAQVHDPVIPIEVIGPQMVACAKAAKVPVCVHLDHGSRLYLYHESHSRRVQLHHV